MLSKVCGLSSGLRFRRGEQKAEIRDQKSETRKQKPGRSNFRCQMTEDKGPRTKDQGPMARHLSLLLGTRDYGPRTGVGWG